MTESSIQQLAQEIQRQHLVGGEEILDYLWCSRWIGLAELEPEPKEPEPKLPGDPEPPPEVDDNAKKAPFPEEPKNPPKEKLPSTPPDPQPEEIEIEEPETDLFEAGGGSASTDEALPVRQITLPGARPFRDSEALARALRPLRIGIDQSTDDLDEELTIEDWLETGILFPRFQNRKASPFRITVIQEASGSSRFWSAWVEDWLDLVRKGTRAPVERLFLHSCDSAKSDEAGEWRLSRLERSRPTLGTRFLNAPAPQRLILWVTDFASPHWRSGHLFQIATRWARWHPVSFLTPLSRNLQRRTVLKSAPESFAHCQELGRPRWLGQDLSFQRRPFFLVRFDSSAVENWACVVTGQAATGHLAISWDGQLSDPIIRSNGEPPHLTAEQIDVLVEKARRNLTPSAYLLSQTLAAAPLTTGIMRLVQQALYPWMSHEILAEVLFSGLIYRRPNQEEVEADKTQYEFRRGDTEAGEHYLRDALFNGPGNSFDKAEQVQRIVGDYLTEHFGPNPFGIDVIGPAAEGEGSAPTQELIPLARVLSHVWQQFDGERAREGVKIRRIIDGEPLPKPVPQAPTEHTTIPPEEVSVADDRPSDIEKNSAGMTMIGIPSGEFWMGSPESEKKRSNDETQHHVILTQPFRMAQTPVTQSQWQAIMGTTIRELEKNKTLDSDKTTGEGDAHPVYFVTWEDALRFCDRLTKQDRDSGNIDEIEAYSLPTEAQWEYSCRAETETAYAGEGLEDYGWFRGNSESTTYEVRGKKPNGWNIYDMHGNVWEWCADWYEEKLGEGALEDPEGPKTGSARVVRGGSWSRSALHCRSAFRFKYTPSGRLDSLGFRPVLANKQQRAKLGKPLSQVGGYRVFISYRRGDLLADCYNSDLYHALHTKIPGQVFRDKEEITAGRSFEEEILPALEDCEKLVVCISDVQFWLGANENPRRIDDEDDWVRREIRAGIVANKIVPVLFGAADSAARPLTNEELPQEMHGCQLTQSHLFARVDTTDAGRRQRDIDDLVQQLWKDLAVPAERSAQAAEFYAILTEIRNQNGELPTRSDLARLYYLSLGLTTSPERFLHWDQSTNVHDVITNLGRFQGPQLFRFAIGCQRWLANHPNEQTQLHAERLAEWLRRMAAAENVLFFGERIREKWLTETDLDQTLRVQVRINLQPEISKVGLAGCLLLGEDKAEIPFEAVPTANFARGKSMDLALEPLFRGLTRWLRHSIGDSALTVLDPQIEFFADDDQLAWPVERVVLDDNKMLGSVYAFVLRIYRSREGRMDRVPSQSIELWDAAIKRDPSQFDIIAKDWQELAANCPDGAIGFHVTSGWETSTAQPATVIRDCNLLLGLWNRSQIGLTNLGENQELNNEAHALAERYKRPIWEVLPFALRNLRKKNPQGGWNDIALLFDPPYGQPGPTDRAEVDVVTAAAMELGLAFDQHCGPGGLIFNHIPAGSFTMGRAKGEEGRYDDETPHEVSLTQDFWMAEAPVTQAQWIAVMGGRNPSNFTESGEDAPVERVSWKDATAYCVKLNELELDEEWEYALPTEAQWEYACRAGTTKRFNVKGADLADLGWFEDSSDSRTHPVKQNKPNAWGLYDLHGNVREWCQDWFTKNLAPEPATDPQGPESGALRVVRGGGWGDPARRCRSAFRDGGVPSYQGSDLGFRPVRRQKTPKEVAELEPETQVQASKDRGPHGMQFAVVEAGKFLMGSPEGEQGREDDEDLHQVTLTRDFEIADAPVTQEQWTSIMEEGNPSGFQEAGTDAPVERVTWEDAVRFCEKLSALDPKWKYRLPYEAEWEFACRAGTQTDRYVTGVPLGQLGWYKENSDESTHPIRLKKPNSLGLYDLYGNVVEWCLDWYTEHLGYEAVVDPTGPESGHFRVLRGACWWHEDRYCRSSARFWPTSTEGQNNYGIRPVRLPKKDDDTEKRVGPRGDALKERDFENPAGMKMLCLEDGTFTMGEGETAHPITLSEDFFIAETPVTQAQWEKVMGSNPSQFQNAGPDAPVEKVSWIDAMEFCARLNETASPPEGWEYTLPTEAQWEYACRAGTTTPFWWGNEWEEGRANAGNGPLAGDQKKYFQENGLPTDSTMPVWTFDPNPWGLYDVTGNVWEWCADSVSTDPEGPETGDYRVICGGCWSGAVQFCRSAARGRYDTGDQDDSLGFRLALARQNTPAKDVAAQLELPQEADGQAEARSADVIAADFTNSIGSEMLCLPAGTFTMGSPPDEEGREPFEAKETQHEVHLTEYVWLAKTPVTQKQWNKVMGTTVTDQANKGGTGELTGVGDDHPIYFVSWEEALGFCDALTVSERKAGRLNEDQAYTLPTEAQWEYGCRAGTIGPFANEDLESLGWHSENSGETTHSVGEKAPNFWGLQDMHGNVWEWCADRYQPDLGTNTVTNPTGPETGNARVVRGGSWNGSAHFGRSGCRYRHDPDYRGSSLGFRLVLAKSNQRARLGDFAEEQHHADSKVEDGVTKESEGPTASGGRYQIQGAIAQGRQSVIYKAFDTQLQKEVALKRRLIPEDAPQGVIDDTSDKLLHEATTLSALNHPNIVTVHDVGRDESGEFLVMELLSGETLEETVNRGLLTFKDFSDVANQTLEALIAAQAIGLQHRDLNPSHLMVIWRPSGKFQIKILGFGMAKIKSGPSKQTMNQDDSILGSIHFMAPEQFERGKLDSRTDLYALGAIFYYSLTGVYPFAGETAPQVMAAHLQHNVRALKEIRPDLSEDVCNWVMWLIDRDINQRPSDAREALERFPLENDNSSSTSQPQVMTPTLGTVGEVNPPGEDKSWQFKFWCFMAYRHSDNREADREWASWLQREIEQYQVPAELVGTKNDRGEVIPDRIYPVFRDEEVLPASADLAEAISDAIRKSRCMITICSPSAVQSEYVAAEISQFQELGRGDRMFSLIIAGEPGDAKEECFPEPLRKTEPLAVDFRTGHGMEGFTSAAAYEKYLKRSGENHSKAEIRRKVAAYAEKLEAGKLKLIAGILGVDYDQLRRAKPKRSGLFGWLRGG